MSLLEEVKESENSLININSSEFGISVSEANNIAKCFHPVIQDMISLVDEYKSVIELDEEDSNNTKIFKELKQKFVKTRTSTAKIHKEQKAYYLAGGKYVDSWKNEQAKVSERYENDLEKKAKYFEIQEQLRINDLRTNRLLLSEKYSEFMPSIDFGVLVDDEFNKLLNGAKLQYEQNEIRIKEEEKQRKEQEEKDRIEKETLRQQLAEQSMIQEEERKKRLEVENELKAIKEKEEEEKRKIELDRLKKEEELKSLSEEELISKWIDNFELPEIQVDSKKVNEIVSKFIAFKVWAKKL